MLDVIADFWKPAGKKQLQEPLKPEQLQIGSSLGFGFVPQAALSGRRLYISAINTYQFGDESLTSFVLSYDKDTTTGAPGVSMIVAESDGEYYLAISRRILAGDRDKIFDIKELESVLAKTEAGSLACKEGAQDFKGWVVSRYKREITGMKGRIYKSDHRKIPLSAGAASKEFEYSLLVSESNEHAIEVEKYTDGHLEIYATVYRRVSDIGEVTHPGPDLKLTANTPKAPTFSSAPPTAAIMPVIAPPSVVASAPKSTPIKLQEFPATPAPQVKQEPVPVAPVQIATKPAPVVSAPAPTPVPTAAATPAIKSSAEKTTALAESESAKPALFVKPSLPENFNKQEIRTVTNNAVQQFENDAIECDLRVANKIIDEAIRNEMRLTDIVRRIIELPVAYPESVQIPVSLTDEDYALLAIRYSVAASDRNAIKRRIIEDLNDFSGNQKKAA